MEQPSYGIKTVQVLKGRPPKRHKKYIKSITELQKLDEKGF
jgi:hypothetical protein